MRFQRGNKLAKGGVRPGSGRPRKEQVEIERTAEQLAREMLERNCQRIMGTYVDLAVSGQDSATTRHAVERIIPNEQIDAHRPIIINHIQFSNRDNPAIDVSPAALPATFLASDGAGNQAGSSSLASSGGKRPIVFKLHDNTDANGDGR